jgi:UDP-glucose 4-epimerase
MSNKPTVLVTGGAGYIGSHAVLALTDAGWPVVVVDNLSTGFRFAIPDGVPLIEADIGDQAAVEAVMRAHEVKAVMHFAGSIVVPESVENPLKYYHNNTVNSRALIESAVRCGVPHFIFSSTAATYGVPEVSPHFGKLPAATDQSLWHVEADDRGDAGGCRRRSPRSTIARSVISMSRGRTHTRAPASPTAGRDPPHQGRGRGGAGQARAMSASIGTDYATPDGTGVRDYIHVSDLAAAHVLALEALIADPARSLQPSAQLRLRPRLLGARGARRRGPRHQPEPSTRRLAPSPRPAIPASLVSDNRPHHGHAPLATPLRRARHHQSGTPLAWERKLTEIRR